MNRHFRNILVSSTIGLALTILSIGYSLGGSYSASGFSSPGVYNTTSMGYPLHYYTEYTLVYCPYPYSCLGDHTDFSLLDAVVDFLVESGPGLLSFLGESPFRIRRGNRCSITKRSCLHRIPNSPTLGLITKQSR